MEVSRFTFKGEEWLIFNFLEPLSDEQFMNLQDALTSIDENVIVLNQPSGIDVDPNIQ